MDVEIERALKTDDLIDITTVGRKTGEPHKIEIAFHNLDGSLYISGLPGRRDWYANMVAHPQFTFHLKKSCTGYLPLSMPRLDSRSTPVFVMQAVEHRQADDLAHGWLKKASGAHVVQGLP